MRYELYLASNQIIRKMNLFKTLVALATLLFSINVVAQDELLPKYPTETERSYMEAKAAALNSKNKPQRPGSNNEAKAGPDSCEDICGDQADSGCWCDSQCVDFSFVIRNALVARVLFQQM